MPTPTSKKPQKSLIKEASDSIYNMYEDAALKGYLGTKAQVSTEERIKARKRQGK